jgi:hypothetical protein
MKPGVITFWLVIGLAVSACAPAVPPTATPTAVPAPTTLKTAVGDLAVASARLVGEVNGVQAGAGEKILLVILSQPGQAKLSPDTFPLEAFQKALQDLSNGQVHISTAAGAEAICSMAGWVEGEFAMGFRVPEAANTYTLFWPGNAPLAVVPAN